MITRPAISVIHAALLMLVLVAFCARAFIPAGFMPDMTEAGGSPFVICSGFEEKTIYLDEEGKPVEKQEKMSEPCSFALNKAGLTALSQGPLLSITLVVDNVSAALEDTYIAIPLVHTPPVRGPPILTV